MTAIIHALEASRSIAMITSGRTLAISRDVAAAARWDAARSHLTAVAWRTKADCTLATYLGTHEDELGFDGVGVEWLVTAHDAEAAAQRQHAPVKRAFVGAGKVPQRRLQLRVGGQLVCVEYLGLEEVQCLPA